MSHGWGGGRHDAGSTTRAHTYTCIYKHTRGHTRRRGTCTRGRRRGAEKEAQETGSRRGRDEGKTVTRVAVAKVRRRREHKIEGERHSGPAPHRLTLDTAARAGGDRGRGEERWPAAHTHAHTQMPTYAHEMSMEEKFEERGLVYARERLSVAWLLPHGPASPAHTQTQTQTQPRIRTRTHSVPPGGDQSGARLCLCRERGEAQGGGRRQKLVCGWAASGCAWVDSLVWDTQDSLRKAERVRAGGGTRRRSRGALQMRCGNIKQHKGGVRRAPQLRRGCAGSCARQEQREERADT